MLKRFTCVGIATSTTGGVGITCSTYVVACRGLIFRIVLWIVWIHCSLIIKSTLVFSVFKIPNRQVLKMTVDQK
jgi:hypothetical protein